MEEHVHRSRSGGLMAAVSAADAGAAVTLLETMKNLGKRSASPETVA